MTVVSKTVLMAEVKTFVPYFRKCSDLIFAPVDYNKPAPLPDVDPSTITQYRGCANGEFKDASHTEFHDGGVHQTGFTTAFPPNTRTGERTARRLLPTWMWLGFVNVKGGRRSPPSRREVIIRAA